MANKKVGSLAIELKYQLKELEKGQKRVEAGLKRLEDGAKKGGKGLNDLEKKGKKAGGAFSSLGKTIKGAAAALGLFWVGGKIKEFATEVLGAATALEQQKVAFTGLLQSAELANEYLDELTEFGKRTPFTIPGVRETAKQLLAYDIAQKDVIPTMQMMGDLALGNQEKFNRLTYAYGQVRAANKLYGTELRQFTETGIPVIDALAEHFGVVKSEVRSMVEEGKVSFDDLKAALGSLTAEGGKFYGQMAEGAKTLPGIWSNIKDTMIQAMEKFGDTTAYEKIKEGLIWIQDNLESIINKASKAFMNFATTAWDISKAVYNMGKSFLGAIGGVKGLGKILQVYLSFTIANKIAKGLLGIGSSILTFSQNAKKGAKGASGFSGVLKGLKGGFASLISPIGLASAAIGTAIYLWVEAKRKAKELEKAERELTEQTIELGKQLGELSINKKGKEIADGFEEQIRKVRDLKKEMEELPKAYEKAKMSGNFRGLNSMGVETTMKSRGDIESQIKNLNADRVIEYKNAQDELNSSLIEYQVAMGKNRVEATAFTKSLELMPLVSIKDQFNAVANDMEKNFAPAFEKTKEEIFKTAQVSTTSSKKFSDALTEAIQDATKEWHIGGDALANRQKAIVEEGIKRVAEADGIGEALVFAFANGITDNEEVAEIAGVKLTDNVIQAELQRAIESKNIGATNALLFALGIEDKIPETTKSADNLAGLVIDTLNKNKKPAGQAAANYASTVSNNLISKFNQAGRSIQKSFQSMFKIFGDAGIQASNNIAQPFFEAGKRIEANVEVVGDDVKQKYSDSISSVASGLENSLKKVKAETKSSGGGKSSESEAEKQLKKDYEELEKQVEESLENVSDYQKKATDKVNDEMEKWEDQITEVKDELSTLEKSHEESIDSAKDDLRDLNHELGNLTDSYERAKQSAKNAFGADLAGDLIKYQEAIEDNKKAIEEAKEDYNKLYDDGELSDSDIEKRAELKEKENELLEENIRLQEEIKLIQGTVSQGEIDEAERISGLSETEKKIEAYEKEKEAREKQFEEEKAILEEKQAILQAYAEGRLSELDTIQDYENQKLFEKLEAEQLNYETEKERLLTQQAELEEMEASHLAKIRAQNERVVDALIKKYEELRKKKEEAARAGGFKGGGVVGYASGGKISGPGDGTSDSIIARVSNGEYIVNAKATKAYLPLLESINSMRMPSFANGGTVNSNNKTFKQNLNIQTQGNVDPNVLARQIAFNSRFS